MDRSSSRRERRTYRRAARRRKRRLQLWLSVAPALLVIGAVTGVLVAVGGPRDTHSSESFVVTSLSRLSAQPGAAEDVLVAVTDQGAARVFVLLHPREEGGTALGIPGATLTYLSGVGFVTVSEVYAQRGAEGVAEALAADLGAAAGPAGEVSWIELRQAASALQTSGHLPQTLAGASSKEARDVASTLLSVLLHEGVGSKASDSQGTAGFADVLEGRSKLEGMWIAGAVWGRPVVGSDYMYIEPYLTRAKQALYGSDTGGPLVVELRNVSVAPGVSEWVVQALNQLGFEVSPAEPGEIALSSDQTRLVFSSGAREEARDICELLGLTVVAEDPTLSANRVVLVLGKDFVPTSLPAVFQSGEKQS
ncbi:MAG: LytR C-terminal domain-containing protein [Thermoleophilia bacterium]|nr:LytR C-terminal domain-containing protein [Thermoleophilia bacterium]